MLSMPHHHSPLEMAMLQLYELLHFARCLCKTGLSFMRYILWRWNGDLVELGPEDESISITTLQK